MREHPLIFNTEMVKAILAGNKTQTRRVPVERYRNWKVGDQLWVRETWYYDLYSSRFFYKADDENAIDSQYWLIKWKPSIFMPRWASRITLEITGLREEYVQDIRNCDCLDEGIEGCFKALDKFKILWDSINKKRGYGWNANPMVKVIQF